MCVCVCVYSVHGRMATTSRQLMGSGASIGNVKDKWFRPMLALDLQKTSMLPIFPARTRST